MGDQSASLVGFRSKPTGAEHDVLTYRVSLSIDILRRSLGSLSGMYPHPRKIVAKALFHFLAQREFSELPGLGEGVVHTGGRVPAVCPPACPA